jgi:hypothetical protein
MAGLIRILLIFFLFMLAARLIRRYVFPLIFKKATDRMKRDMEERMRAQRDMNDTRREGEIRVEKGNKTSSKSQKVEEGEYVDYEEVD